MDAQMVRDDEQMPEEHQPQQQLLTVEREADPNGNTTDDQPTGQANWRNFDVRYSTFKKATKKVNLMKEFDQYGDAIQQYERNTLNKPTVTAEREMKSLRTSFGRLQNQVTAERLQEAAESPESILASLQAMSDLLVSRSYLTRADLELHRLHFLEAYNRLAVALVRETVNCSLMLAVAQVNKLASFLKEVADSGSVLDSSKARFEEVNAMVNTAKGYCSTADQLMEEYYAEGTKECRRRELAGQIRLQRDLITMKYSQAVEKMANLEVTIRQTHFNLMVQKINLNAYRRVNIKIAQKGGSQFLIKGRYTSLAFTVANGSGAFIDLLKSKQTKGELRAVEQLEGELANLSDLIHELKSAEEKATQFLNSNGRLRK